MCEQRLALEADMLYKCYSQILGHFRGPGKFLVPCFPDQRQEEFECTVSYS